MVVQHTIKHFKHVSKSYLFLKYTGLPAYPRRTCHLSCHLLILERAQCGAVSCRRRCFCARRVGCHCAHRVASSSSPPVVWVRWRRQHGTTIAIVVVVAAHVVLPSSPLRVLHHVSSALSLRSLCCIVASGGMIR